MIIVRCLARIPYLSYLSACRMSLTLQLVIAYDLRNIISRRRQVSPKIVKIEVFIGKKNLSYVKKNISTKSKLSCNCSKHNFHFFLLNFYSYLTVTHRSLISTVRNNNCILSDGEERFVGVAAQ